MENAEEKGRNQEQFDRYKKAMNHAVFTDYLRFLFYESGNETPIFDICIGTCQNDEIIPTAKKANCLLKILRKHIVVEATCDNKRANVMPMLLHAISFILLFLF